MTSRPISLFYLEVFTVRFALLIPGLSAYLENYNSSQRIFLNESLSQPIVYVDDRVVPLYDVAM